MKKIFTRSEFPVLAKSLANIGAKVLRADGLGESDLLPGREKWKLVYGFQVGGNGRMGVADIYIPNGSYPELRNVFDTYGVSR